MRFSFRGRWASGWRPVRVALALGLLAPLLLSGPARGVSAQEPSTRPTGFLWPQPQAPATPRVLFIGIDGVRVDVLREVPTPNLDALAAAGSFTDDARNVTPTISGPCWSSMLIGVGPEKHGVLNNDFSTNRYSRYPDFLTRIETVRPELKTFIAVDWLPLGAQDAGGPLITDAVDEKFIIDGYEHGWAEADSMSVDATVRALQEEDFDALFVYLGNPDVASHDIGGIGGPYRESIALADREVGRLVEAVRARPHFSREDWLILVATDHGRTDGGGHGGDSLEEVTVFYLASGPSTRVGTPTGPVSIMDLPVTAMAHLGIRADPAWGLEGRVVGIEPDPSRELQGRRESAPPDRAGESWGNAAETAPPADTLRILAYNTHHGEGLDGLLDLERIAGVIRAVEPDVVALQEIDVGVERVGGVDQARRYGHLTGLSPLFGAFMPYQGGHYGMALLSRLPILTHENVPLPPGAEPRSTLAARIRLPSSGREVWVAGIHFYRTEEERLAQARETMAFFQGVEEPVFLVGDFNSQPGGPVLGALEASWHRPEKAGGSFTFPADGPEREIDFILIRPQQEVRVLEYRVLDEAVASDHRPVFMVVEIR